MLLGIRIWLGMDVEGMPHPSIEVYCIANREQVQNVVRVHRTRIKQFRYEDLSLEALLS